MQTHCSLQPSRANLSQSSRTIHIWKEHFLISGLEVEINQFMREGGKLVAEAEGEFPF